MSSQLSSKAVATFGEEEEVEQMLQVLHSDEIKEEVITKFNLIDHYDIDASSKYPQTALAREYKSNISYSRTEFMSVEITVLDKDKNKAAAIANTIGDLLDSAMNNIEKQRAHKGLEIVRAEYFLKKSEMLALEDSMKLLREFGVYDYESQSEVFNTSYAEAIAMGNTKAIEAIEKKLHVLAKYGGAYVSIRDYLKEETKQLSLLKAKYAEAKVDAEQIMPHKFVVNKAVPAEKKSYPIRWLIVMIATFGSAIFSLFTLIITDYFRQLKMS